MPIYTTTRRFLRDYDRLTPEARERFLATLRDAFIPDVESGSFRPGLRVKRVQRTPGVFEMTFAPDGRATWQYGPAGEAGVPHVVWRRVGTHDVLADP